MRRASISERGRSLSRCLPGRDPEPVRVFQTFTADLNKMAEWLRQCGITTVAMESTGVYWIPVYEVIERHGIQACLVNPRNMKNVPGRRTDWHECQWIQYLHSMGLLQAAFRTEADVCAVRALMRHRSDLVAMASASEGSFACQFVQRAVAQLTVSDKIRRKG